MRYVEMKDMHIFPISHSVQSGEQEYRQLSESNIIKLMTSFTDAKSYVLNYNSTTKVMEFVIGGHYVKMKLPVDAFEGAEKTDIWATILMGESPIKPPSSSTVYVQDKNNFLVVGPASYYDGRGDISGKPGTLFLGLQLTASTTKIAGELPEENSINDELDTIYIPNGFYTTQAGGTGYSTSLVDIISLHLLTKDGSTWVVPTDSKKKFDASSFTFAIDGGDIAPQP